MVESKKKVYKGTGKVAFLANLEGIKKMIEAGYPKIAVFEEYEKRLSIKSGQFGKYVREYIEGGETKQKETISKKEKPKGKEGFTVDPKLKNEDLY